MFMRDEVIGAWGGYGEHVRSDHVRITIVFGPVDGLCLGAVPVLC